MRLRIYDHVIDVCWWTSWKCSAYTIAIRRLHKNTQIAKQLPVFNS